jgi:hypothetical protein
MARNFAWQQDCRDARINRKAEYAAAAKGAAGATRVVKLDNLKNFLASVTGGSGKTRWATQEAKADLDEGIKLVIVVATTKNVRLNWRDTMKDAGKGRGS